MIVLHLIYNRLLYNNWNEYTYPDYFFALSDEEIIYTDIYIYLFHYIYIFLKYSRLIFIKYYIL